MFWRTNPFAAAAIICGVKASAADYIAQRRQIKKRDKTNSVAGPTFLETSTTTTSTSTGLPTITTPTGTSRDLTSAPIVVENTNSKADLRRNFAFILYGSLYQGMAQEFIYNHLYPQWFGSGTDPMTVLIKVSFDVTLQTTFVTLPIAYFAKAIIFNYSFQEALSRYTDDIVNHGLLKKYISLWFPVNCLTFSIVPEYLRVSWIAFISFFWLIILSSIASRPRTSSAIEVEAVADVRNEEDDDDEYCLLTDGTTCNIDG
jgi:Mpv17 / PMP22 family